MKNEKMNVYVRFSFVSEHRKMKNRICGQFSFFSFLFFFLTQNGNETNREIKKNNQSRYNRFPRNFFYCCHLLL